MHPLQSRNAFRSGVLVLLLTSMPPLQGVATAEPPIDPDAARQPGEARRPPSFVRFISDALRVGGQPQAEAGTEPTYGELAAEPPPVVVDGLRFPRFPRTLLGCGGGVGGIACGLESCPDCRGGGALEQVMFEELTTDQPGTGGDPAADADPLEAYPLEPYPLGAYPLDAHSLDPYPRGAFPAAVADPAHGLAPMGFASPSMIRMPSASPGARHRPRCAPPLQINWCRFELFGGVQGFSGPMSYAGDGTAPQDRDGSSSFGIHQGINGAHPLALLDRELSFQLGVRGVQSNSQGAEFTAESRRQTFVTGGFFRRVDYGLQGGFVADYLNDDWYYDLNLVQLRGEISWMCGDGNEFGYAYAAGLSDDTSEGAVTTSAGDRVAVRIAAETTNQNRLFYRRHFHSGGSTQLFAGFSGDNDGLFGALLELPLHDAVALRSGFTYLHPDWVGEPLDHQEESWNLGISLVWYPCGGCDASRYHRPLMSVADNGTLMVDRQ